MIRLTNPDETPELIALAKATGLFEPAQLDELAQILKQYFDNTKESGDRWFTYWENKPVGVAYVAPERMTEGVWNLYLIAIHPDYQKKGYGKALLQYVEQILANQGERILLVETSGTDDFAYVRAFYRSNGYEEEACIREFYAPGVDKVVFRKAF
ncbi:MAG: GNAT family N-acetyltransferase [Leptolyngbya sp. BL-A-14]